MKRSSLASNWSTMGSPGTTGIGSFFAVLTAGSPSRTSETRRTYERAISISALRIVRRTPRRAAPRGQALHTTSIQSALRQITHCTTGPSRHVKDGPAPYFRLRLPEQRSGGYSRRRRKHETTSLRHCAADAGHPPPARHGRFGTPITRAPWGFVGFPRIVSPPASVGTDGCPRVLSSRSAVPFSDRCVHERLSRAPPPGIRRRAIVLRYLRVLALRS